MNGATTAPDDVGRYVGAVRDALADLRRGARRPAPRGRGFDRRCGRGQRRTRGGSPGPPEEFAAELREAAGSTSLRLLRARSMRSCVRSLAARFGTRLAPHPLARTRPRADLWVARGYTAVGILAVWLGTGWAERYPFVPRFDGSAALGVALVALSVAASSRSASSCGAVRSGRVLPSSPNLALVVALWARPRRGRQRHVGKPAGGQVVEAPTEGLALDEVPITDIYPYDRTGSSSTTSSLRPGRRAAQVPGNQDVDPN